MDIITGYVGKAHVTAEQDRDINQGIVGSGSYVLRTGMEMAAEVSSNNEIKIRDGVLMHQGCAASIKKNTYDSLTIVNGSQGMKRIDLIVARYSRSKDTGGESLKLIVIQGTPTTGTATVPSYTKGDIQAGDYVADMPMYQVILNGLNITEVKKVFETAPNLAEINSKIIGTSEIIVGRLSLTYESTSLLSGEVTDLGISSGYAIASCHYMSGQPYDQVTNIYTQPISNGRLAVYAKGAGFVNGHRLLITYIAVSM